MITIRQDAHLQPPQNRAEVTSEGSDRAARIAAAEDAASARIEADLARLATRRTG